MTRQKIRRYNYLSGEIAAIYHAAAARMGISDSALSVLYVVCECGGSCLQSEIYKQTGASRQTVNSAIRRLEKDGVAYLEQGQGRSTVVRLTKRGARAAARTARRVIEAENEIFGEWTAAELKTYLELTERYKNSLKEKLEKLP